MPDGGAQPGGRRGSVTVLVLDGVLAGLTQAIARARADLAICARGDELRQAPCLGQVLASGEAAAYIDEAIVAVFDLWQQYDAPLAAQTTVGGQAAVVAAASPDREPQASPASAERPARSSGVPGPLPGGEDIKSLH